MTLRPRTTIRGALAALLLAVTLAACGQPARSDTSTPTAPLPTAPSLTPVTPPPATAAPATATTAPATATTVPATATPAPSGPTAIPTATGNYPTAEPVATKPPPPGPGPSQPQPQRPIIGFDPKAGGPGTRVSVFGSGYVPGQTVVIRLGMSQPMGDVLATAIAGQDGRWSTSLVLPERLPSGELISGRDFHLVAMDANNRALASAPFSYTPAQVPGPDRAQAPFTVAELLRTWQRGGNVRPFLAQNLTDELDRGRPADQVLGLHPIELKGFMPDTWSEGPGGVIYAPFFLNYGDFTEKMIFTLLVQGSGWKVTDTALDQSHQNVPSARSATEAVQFFLQQGQIDAVMPQAKFYLAGELRQAVETGRIRSIGEVVQMANGYGSFTVDGIAATDQRYVYVQATLFEGQVATSGVVRLFRTAAAADGSWLIDKVTPQPAERPQWPGTGYEVLARGDYSGDGIEETIYIATQGVVPQANFSDGYLAQQARSTVEVMIAQVVQGSPQIMFRADYAAVRSPGAMLIDYAGGGPTAYMVALDPGSSCLVNLLPLRADGTQHSNPLCINWNAAQGGYRLSGPGI